MEAIWEKGEKVFHFLMVPGLTKIYLKIYNPLRSLLVSDILLTIAKLGMENALNFLPIEVSTER